MFSRAPEYRIIELPHATRLEAPSTELKEQLSALKHNPAFMYLLARFEREKAELERQLKEGFTLTETQLRFLQAGIHYAGWFEREVKRITNMPKPISVTTTDEDRALFERAQQSLELVGSPR